MFDRKAKKSPSPLTSPADTGVPKRKMMGGPPEPQSESKTESPETATSPLRPTLPSRSSSDINTSTLNPNLTIEGSVRFEGSLVVNCKVQGSITSNDHLVVGPSGNIEAGVEAGTIEISGVVKGDIKAKESVRILSGGEVVGDIETPTISMEEGVVFEGRCTRPAPTSEKQPAESMGWDAKDEVEDEDENENAREREAEEDEAELTASRSEDF